MLTDLISRLSAGRFEGDNAEVLALLQDARAWFENEADESDFSHKRRQCRDFVARLDAILRAKEAENAG